MAEATHRRLGEVVIAAAFTLLVIACGGTTSEGGVASDGGFAPIPCGSLTCEGAIPYCFMPHKCGGFGPCTAPRSDGGGCPADYQACDDSTGKPGCTPSYTYSCIAIPQCTLIGTRTYGNCNC